MALVIEKLRANAGDLRDTGLIPGLGRSPAGRNGNPLQYPCLENSPGQWSLAGYSLRSQCQTRRKWLSMHASPLQKRLNESRRWLKAKCPWGRERQNAPHQLCGGWGVWMLCSSAREVLCTLSYIDLMTLKFMRPAHFPDDQLFLYHISLGDYGWKMAMLPST